MCPSCGIGFQWPPRTPEEQDAYYRRTYYNSHKASFDLDRLRVYEEDMAAVERWVRPGRLLDFGCGFGHFMVLAKKRGWQCVGVDLSEQAVSVARDAFHLDAWAGNQDTVARSGERFDLITLWNVIDHLPDSADTIRLLAGSLSPGGILVIRVSNYRFKRAMFRLGFLVGNNFLKNNFGFFHNRVFTPGSIRGLVRRSGFDRTEVRNSRIAGDVKGKWIGQLGASLLQAGFGGLYRLSFGALPLAPSMLVIARKRR